MDTAQSVAIILSSIGGGSLLLAIAQFIFKQATGRAGREREYNTSVESQRAAAIEERDAINRNWALDRDDNSRLRGLLIENRLDPGPRVKYEPTTARGIKARRTKEAK